MSSRILAGRYELLEKIGDGGMAVVYKARCRLLNRFVAIKILKPEFARDLKFIENFRRESQAAASLSHPNIVNIYDVGREGNIHYIVMELIEGYILSDMIKEQGTIEWKRAVEITKQIASALSFAHKNHIIHRDVKPHNILITQDGTAKITDFGIAKALNSGTSSETTGTVMGSVHYFSPEQAKGGYVDEKSDIYSLGIVLYEMVTGRVPFDGDNPVSVALMHINDKPTPPTEINPAVPQSIEDVVLKATSKFQIERYATADDMYKALQDAEFMEMLGTRTKSAAAAASDKKDDSDSDKPADDEKISSEKRESGSGSGNKTPGEGKKKFNFNKFTVLAIVAALIVAIPLTMGIFSIFSGIGDGGEDEFAAPDFRGMTFEQAQIKAEEYGLELKEGDTVYSEYEAGQISSQTPEEGASVKAGKTITVNISKGMKEGTVPKIEGMTYESAVYLLEKYGYKVGSVTQQTSTQPKDIVLSQNPEAGDEATPGTAISFVVSKGTEETEAIVPLLVGMELDAAKEALELAGLKPGLVTYEESDAYEENQVFWQQYTAETVLAKDTTVDIKVSGVDPSSVPQEVSMYINYSYAEDSVFWLTVTVSDEMGTHNIITREQRIKEDEGETITLTGQGVGTVTVIFNNDAVEQRSVDFNTGVIE